MRTLPRQTRRLAALALAILAAPALDAAVAPREARAESTPSDLAVGTELIATADVSLDKAKLVKGSKVSVTKLFLRDGRLDGVNVALADGHVVKMPLAMVRSYFRVVRE